MPIQILKTIIDNNTTIVNYVDANGYKTSVGIPFVCETEEECEKYITENYSPFDKNDAGKPTEEYLQFKYRDQRASEYPSIQEQLDMQYWDAVNGTTTWLDTIQAIKNKYPKG